MSEARFYGRPRSLSTNSINIDTLVYIAIRILEAKKLINVKTSQIQDQSNIDSVENLQVQESEVRYRTLFEYAPDGILIADANSYYLDANPSMCQMLGYSREELIGLHASKIVVPSEIQHIEPALSEIKATSDYHRQWQFQRKDGSVFEAEVFVTQMPDGNLLGMVRDITLSKAHEQEISRLSRLYEALSQINQAIVWMTTREELFQKICRVLGEHGGFHMVWIGWHDPDTQQLVPVADWGDEAGYIRKIKIYADERPEGQGPSGSAFRAERPFISNDTQNDPVTLPWREEIVRRNFRASAAFPIKEQGKVCGTLSVYADKAFFFHDKEIALLEEAANNISFALDNLVREEERKRAENAVKSERLFSDTMLESMPGILYFYDNKGQFLRWNKNFEIVSGYFGDEISRMHPLDFFSEQEKKPLTMRIAEVFEKGESSVEASLISKTGEAKPHFFTGRKVIFNGVECLVGMGIDITELKQAESRLAESEQKYRELVELANSIILRWDSEGKITFLNEFGQRFFGYAADEIIGRHVMGSIVPDTDSSGRNLQSLMEQICSDPKAFEQNVNENVRRNGERVWISWTNKFVSDAQGKIIEILSIGTDITERRQAEREVRELNATLEQRVVERTEQLNATLIRAEAADKIKSAFLATMSHEFRTPLNSIIGFTGIILQGLAGPLNAEQTKQLGMVRGSARHLLELINDVLDISKIEAGQLEVHAALFDLRESIERVMALVSPMAEKKGLALTMSMAPDIGDMVSDRRRFEQILINLLNNAIKFTDHGSVTLIVEPTENFCPDGISPQPAVCFRVKDTGMGIKLENLKTLFQAFHQIDSGLTRQHEGTGLGLAICRRLASLLSGEVSASSEWSKGSEFTLILPLHQSSGRS